MVSFKFYGCLCWLLCFFFLATPLGDRIQAASFLRFQASMAIDCHCLQAVVAIVLHQACVAEIFSSKSSWLFGFPRMAIRRLSRILYPGSTARLNKWEVKLKLKLKSLAMANGAATAPAGKIVGVVDGPENVTLKWQNNATSVQLGRLHSVWCILFVVLSNVYSIYLHQFFSATTVSSKDMEWPTVHQCLVEHMGMVWWHVVAQMRLSKWLGVLVPWLC